MNLLIVITFKKSTTSARLTSDAESGESSESGNEKENIAKEAGNGKGKR